MLVFQFGYVLTDVMALKGQIHVQLFSITSIKKIIYIKLSLSSYFSVFDGKKRMI